MARKPKKQGSSRPSKKKSGRGGGLWTILIAALLTVVIGIILLTMYGSYTRKKAAAIPAQRPAKAASIPEREATREIKVYYSNEDGLYLKPEKRTIKSGAVETEAREAITALIKGPQNKSLSVPLPSGTRLLGLQVSGGQATVDFSPELIKNHQGGATGEIQTVYSVVDTLTLNFHEIKTVQLLVNGKRKDTIAGHIDVSYPLGPDRRAIKE